MYAYDGSLCGNGKQDDDAAGGYKKGDRVGVLLDLSDGSLRFFRNGVQHGPGYAAGSMTGPVVAAVQMFNINESVRLLPNKRAAAGVNHLQGRRRYLSTAREGAKNGDF